MLHSKLYSQKLFCFFSFFFLIVLIPSPANSQNSIHSFKQELLTLSDYLYEVETSHEGLIAALQAAEAASEREEEGELLFAPSLFGCARHIRNKLPSFAADGDAVGVQQNEWSIGVTKQTRLGSQITLSTCGDYVAPLNGGSSLYELRLNQPLWRNWLARETKAQADLLRASALTTKFSKLYQAQVALAQAELLYWQLVICREAVILQRAALQRAITLNEWHTCRAEKNLSTEADILQAEAAFRRYELGLQIAIDQERKVSTLFNSFRGICSSFVPETLISIADIQVDTLLPPCRSSLRNDILSAEQSVELFRAEAEAANQRSYSQVDLFVTAAHKNIKNTPILTESAIDPYRPEFSVGIQINIPLSFGLPSQIREARIGEVEAAELELSRKKFEVEQEWTDLVLRLNEEKEQLSKSRSIEKAEKLKYEAEKERFSLGKSTTYAVINFEQDYMMAQHSTIQRLYNLFEVYTRLKLFRNEP